MATVSSMIIGYPEENKDDLRATLSFIGEAMRQEKAQPHLHLLAPLAGTPLHQRYRQELVLKDIYTDISHNRFNQDANERNLIARYPELFPNFYLFPSHHLEHSYFYEVREFFVHGIRRFRWMLVAWHDRCGDLLALFDEWKEWAKQRCLVLTMPEMRRYYCSPEFDCAFVEFLGRRPAQQRSPFEEILLEFERRLLRSLTRRQERGRKISSPAINNKVRVDLAKNLFFLELAGDYARVISLLQQSLPPDSSIHHPSFILGKISPENGQCEMFLVQPAVATFLSLCDGQASLKQVLTRFAEKFGKIEDIPAREVAEYALQSLHQQKLLRFLSPLPSGHALRSTGKRAYSALSFAVSSTNH
jgi:hypothetical protein